MTKEEMRDSAERQIELYISSDEFQEKVRMYNVKLDSCKRIVANLNEKHSNKSYYFAVFENKPALYIGNILSHIESVNPKNIQIVRLDKKKPHDPNRQVYYSDELWQQL